LCVGAGRCLEGGAGELVLWVERQSALQAVMALLLAARHQRCQIPQIGRRLVGQSFAHQLAGAGQVAVLDGQLDSVVFVVRTETVGIGVHQSRFSTPQAYNLKYKQKIVAQV
jgi:hypothetical protein